MKKSVLVLVFGFMFSTLLSAQPLVNVQENIFAEDDDLPVKVEEVRFKTDKLKAQWVKIQLKSNKSGLEKSVRLLNELKPIVEKMEKQLKDR